MMTKLKNKGNHRHIQIQTIVYKYKSNKELLGTNYTNMANYTYTNVTNYINSKSPHVINV